jgi:hypothetical protein
MEIHFVLLFWVTCIVLTLAVFKWRGQLFFPIMAFTAWNGLALFIGCINWMGFGSVNQIEAMKCMGDPSYEWLIGLGYFFHGMGIGMLLLGIYDTFIVARTGVLQLDESVRTGQKKYDLFERRPGEGA